MSAASFSPAMTPSSPHMAQDASHTLARRGSLLARSPAAALQSVAAAQQAATKAWRSDLRSLLTRAEERFADVCWTTAPPHDDGDESDTASLSDAASSTRRALADWNFEDRPKANPRASDGGQHTVIWAHKAILYARAPNTFQARYLQLRSPAVQLGYAASNASLVSLPTIATGAATPQQSRSTTPTSLAPPASTHSRRSVRGAKPPSSFSMNKTSLRRPSRSGNQPVISVPRSTRASASLTDTMSLTSGIMTSDSEPEGLTLVRTRSRVKEAGTPIQPALHRMPSFASDTDSMSHADTASILSEASTIRAPMSLRGVSQAYFEATLEFLYTGEESMVDAFEFLYEDRVATDAETGPAEKQEKLRSDMTFMWRSKLYSDVKIVLDTGEDDHQLDSERVISNIPDANVSLLSLPQTIDTDRVEESDAEDDELTSFSSHRMILVSRSPYFASMFLSPYADSRAPSVKLPSPPFTPASLHFTLGFLYTGTLFFSNRTFDLTTAFQLWRAGAYLQVETLQHLVAAMIAHDFCHNFACSPPCRKCLKRVPRTLAFASSVDVSDAGLAGMAISAITGKDFGLYWAKEVGNLHTSLRDDIVNLVSERVESGPAQMINVLRQLSIVGRRIDTERASKWVESLRSMSEIIEARLLVVIRTKFEQIIKSKEWNDLLDGVGQLGDVLEKSLVMLVDSLTEARAAQTYQTLVGQVLLRDEGFELSSSKQAVEDARGGVLRYLKRRWINVRALGGFNGLEKWCLKELADELGVSSDDLVLSKEPPASELTRTRTGLRPAVVGSSSASAAGRAVPPQRRAGSLPGSATQRQAGSPRQSMPATSSRLRTTSGSSTSSAPRSTSGVSAASSTARSDADTEREAGPINLRAAVLNRNAARTSVTHGHRSTLDDSPPRASGITEAPAAMTSSTRVGTAASSVRSSASVAQASSAAARTRTTSGASSNATRLVAGRSRVSSGQTSGVNPQPASLRPKASAGTLVAAAASSSSQSASSSASTAPAKVGVPRNRVGSSGEAAAAGPRANGSRTSSLSKSPSVPSLELPAESGSVVAAGKADRPHAPARPGTISAKNSSELLSANASDRTIRTTKSAASLRSTHKLVMTSAAAPPMPTSAARPKSSMDGKAAATSAIGPSQSAKTRLVAKTGSSSAAQVGTASSPVKHAYLKATPRPGGIFSLSSTDSGKDLRQRTLSGNGGSSAAAASTPSTTTSSRSAAASRVPSKAAGARTLSTASARSVGPAGGARATSTASTSGASGTRTVVRSSRPSVAGAAKATVARPAVAAAASRGMPPNGAAPAQPASDNVAVEQSPDMDRPDDASVTTAVEDSGSDADSDLAETARSRSSSRSGSGSDTEEAGDDHSLLDPDQTITSFPLPAPRRVDAAGGLDTMGKGGAHKDVVGQKADDSARTISQLGGTTLSLGIPCIVSCPSSGKGGRKPGARFHATVKYVGPVLGRIGAWVGIEVALPLPRSLHALLDGEPGEDDDEATGGAATASVAATAACPGGLHDGTLDGVRYFDLTMEWDLSAPSPLPFSAGGGGAISPYSPSLGGGDEAMFHTGGFPFSMPPRSITPAPIGGGGPRGGAMTPTLTPTPTGMLSPSPYSYTARTTRGQNRRRYADRPERLERRRMILRQVEGGEARLEEETERQRQREEDEDEGEGEMGTRVKSRGLFIRPSQVLWVVSSAE